MTAELIQESIENSLVSRRIFLDLLEICDKHDIKDVMTDEISAMLDDLEKNIITKVCELQAERDKQNGVKNT